jgi:hypothetical protein
MSVEGRAMNRKEVALKLGDFFEVKPKYLGVPSFAYEVSTYEDTYNIDRQGLIKNSAGEEMSFESIINAREIKIDNENEIIDKEEELASDRLWMEIPIYDHSGATLLNIINMVSSKQKLIARAFGTHKVLIDESFVEELNQKEIISIDDFRASFLEAGAERCKGLLFDFDKGTFTFEIAVEKPNQERIAAFKALVMLIDKNAKMLKHASFKPVQEENPKYAFRTWLIRLGMNGDEYKSSRKVLLAALEGSSAFRRPKDKVGK